MAIDEAGLLAAVNAGVSDANGTTPAPVTTTEPTGGNTDDPSTSGDGGDTQVPNASAPEQGAVPSGEGDAPSDGTPDGAAGDEPAADPGDAAAPVLGADGKPLAPAGAQPDGAAPVKEPDPLNDPLPNALKKETKERIHTLIDRVKTSEAKLTETTRDLDNMLDAVVSTGATPAQYSQSLQYLQLVNSPSRADKEKALEIMQGEMRALATMLGKPVPGVNFLEGHDDLIQAVGTGRITQEHAMELAAARAAQGHVKQVEANSTQQRQQADNQAAAINEGRQGLVAMEARLSRDPQFAAKKAILVPTLRPAFKKMDPRQWPAAFEQAYNDLVLPSAPRPTPPPPANTGASAAGAGGNTPLRAGNAGGAQQVAVPKTAAEAVDLGIVQARG